MEKRKGGKERRVTEGGWEGGREREKWGCRRVGKSEDNTLD